MTAKKREEKMDEKPWRETKMDKRGSNVCVWKKDEVKSVYRETQQLPSEISVPNISTKENMDDILDIIVLTT